MLISGNRAEQPGNRKGNYPDTPAGESNAATLPGKILTSANLSAWTWFIKKGLSNALSGLSQMVGKELGVTSMDLQWTPASKVIDMLGVYDTTFIGIYLTIEGDTTGHMLLIHDSETALHLIDMQLGLTKGSTQELDEMGYSILGEMGNITGSFFLNTLADTAKLVLMPSPPSVSNDSTGIVFNSIMAEYENVFVIRTTFKAAEDDDINGTFIILVSTDSMITLLGHINR